MNALIGAVDHSRIALPTELDTKPLIMNDLHWSPSLNMQSIGRLRQQIPKIKIVRVGRYYMRADMVERVNVPLCFKFRTKREAIKYFKRPVSYMRSPQQFNALFGSSDFNVEHVTTGRMHTKGTAFVFLFASKPEGKARIEMPKQRIKSDTSYTLDLSSLDLKDPDA